MVAATCTARARDASTPYTEVRANCAEAWKVPKKPGAEGIATPKPTTASVNQAETRPVSMPKAFIPSQKESP